MLRMEYEGRLTGFDRYGFRLRVNWSPYGIRRLGYTHVQRHRIRVPRERDEIFRDVPRSVAMFRSVMRKPIPLEDELVGDEMEVAYPLEVRTKENLRLSS